MSTTITLLNDLGSATKQLHDHLKTVHGLPTTIKSTGKVADQLSIIIAAYVAPTTKLIGLMLIVSSLAPAILDTDHDYAWCLGIMEFSIRKFVAISNRIISSKVQDIQPEDMRKMHFAIRQVLMYVRGSTKLMKDIMELPGAREAITAAEAGAGVAVNTAAEAAASVTDANTSNSV
jgi:hypothetical protein